MKLALMLSALLLMQAPVVSAQTSAPKSMMDAAEVKAASVPVETFIKALETDDPALVLKAFYKDAMMIGSDGKGGIYSLPITEMAKNFKGEPSDDEAQRKRSFQIIALTPNTGVARLDLVYPGFTFTDYMTLLKIDGEWKIVQKLYYRRRTPTLSK